MSPLRYRFLFLFLIPLIVVFFAVLSESWWGLEPCLLCMAQRVVYLCIGFFGLLAFLFNPKNYFQRIYALLAFSFSLFGLALAGRQIWLQHLPKDQVPPCGPSFEILIENFPLKDVLLKVLEGTGDCAAVDWLFLGFSMAEWSFGVFLILLGLSFANIFIRKPTKAL